jgi:AAA15 family ATPase/GTPase
MIIEFSITNFGSIREKQTISFEATKDDTLAQYYTFEPIKDLRLLKLAMIFGPNASGKSTVLKALEFLRQLIYQPARNSNDLLEYEPFCLDGTSQKEQSHLELLFVQDGIKYRYNLYFSPYSIIKETLDFSPRGREANFFTRQTSKSYSQSVEIEYGSLVTIDEKNRMKMEIATLKNNTVLGIFSKANIEFGGLKMVYDWFGEHLLPMISPDMDLLETTTKKIMASSKIKEDVTQLLKYADVQIENIEIVEKAQAIHKRIYQEVSMMANEPMVPYGRSGYMDKEVIFNHLGYDDEGNRVLIPFNFEQESQGTVRYFGLSGILATLMNEQKMISIDEFESSLHPDLAQNLILRFLVQSTNSQLLVTTHNIDFLGEQDVIRRDTIWFTQKNKKGATELYSAADFDTSVLRKTSSLLNVYETGKLGAKPNLGSIFS